MTKTYVLRVEVGYEGTAEMPDEHVVRRWVLNSLLQGEPPPGAAPASTNKVTMGVRCAGVESTSPSQPGGDA